MRTAALRQKIVAESAFIVGMSLYLLCMSTSISEAQNASEQEVQKLKKLREESELSKQQYEKDKKTIAAANQALGMLDIFDQQMVKRLDEKRKRGTRFNRWEITKTKTLAPVGTMLYDMLKDPKNVDEANLTKGDDPILNDISAEVARVNVTMATKLKQIEEAKAELKRVTISDDQPSIVKATAAVSKCQTSARELFAAPFQALDPGKLTRGQMGNLVSCRFIDTEVIDSKQGEVEGYLIIEQIVSGGKVRISGLSSDNVPKPRNMIFAPSEYFVVGEKVASKSARKNPGLKQYVELYGCGFIQPFSDDEMTKIEEAIDAKYELKFTADELQKMKTKTEQNKAGLHQRRSQSFLESGKILLKNGNKSAAKKQFEKAVSEGPESDAAKEASKILETLP